MFHESHPDQMRFTLALLSSIFITSVLANDIEILDDGTYSVESPVTSDIELEVARCAQELNITATVEVDHLGGVNVLFTNFKYANTLKAPGENIEDVLPHVFADCVGKTEEPFGMYCGDCNYNDRNVYVERPTTDQDLLGKLYDFQGGKL